MGKYDEQIKQAKKIGENWIAKAEDYKKSFVSIKKDSLALEKSGLNDIQKAVTAGGTDLAKHLEELETIKERLKSFYDEGARIFDEFDKWALVEPRTNMGFIGKKLSLGAPTSEPYKEVAAGIKKQLTDVGTAIADVQRAWRSDLEIAIKNHMDKAEALEKIINKDVGKNKAFLEQFSSGIDRFEKECNSAYGALKLEVYVRDLEEIMNGNMAKNEKVKIEQKYHQAEQRIQLLPSLIEQIDKNYNRVIKSMPDGFAASFIAAGQKKRLDSVLSETKKKFTHANAIFQSAVKAYKEKGLI